MDSFYSNYLHHAPPTLTDLDTVLAAATALERAARHDLALALLDTTTTDQDNESLTLARARAVVARDYLAGVPSSGRPTTIDSSDAVTSWEVAMLDLRRDYADRLVDRAAADSEVVDAMAERATRLRDTAPDEGRRGWACMCLGWLADNLRGDRESAPRFYEQALAAARTTGDPMLLFEAQRHLGDHAHDDGDHPDALVRWRESTEAAARAGYVAGVLAQQLLLAVLARDAGDEAGATLLATEVNRWATAIGAVRAAAHADGFLAGVDPTQPPAEGEQPG